MVLETGYYIRFEETTILVVEENKVKCTIKEVLEIEWNSKKT